MDTAPGLFVPCSHAEPDRLDIKALVAHNYIEQIKAKMAQPPRNVMPNRETRRRIARARRSA